jgi:hypothetical protein
MSKDGTMRIDKLPGSKREHFLPERDAAWPNFDPPQLEWDESEVSAIVDEIVARHSCAE